MSRLLWVAAGGVIVVVGAVLVRARGAPVVSEISGREAPAEVERPNAVRLPAGTDDSPAPSPDAPEPEALSLAVSIQAELLAIRGLVLNPPISEEQRSQASHRERRVRRFIKELLLRLDRNPGEWQPVLDWLLSLEDVDLGPKHEDVAARVASELGGVMDDATRAKVTERALSDPSPRAREVAFWLLAEDRSPTVLPTVLHAFQSDPEDSVRRAALFSLTRRMGRTKPSEASRLTAEVLASRVDVEPDEGIRREARALLEAIESPRTPGTRADGGRSR